MPHKSTAANHTTRSEANVIARMPVLAGDSYSFVLFEQYSEQFIAALLKGDQAVCKSVVDRWLEVDSSLLRLYEQLFQRALYEVGSLWEHGKISVANEHLATFLTESMMAYVYPKVLSRAAERGEVLVACAEAEAHQVGAKMVSDLLEMKGWRSCFLGALASMASLEEILLDRRVKLVALSAALSSHLKQVFRTASMVRMLAPSTPILIGGQAFRNADLQPFLQLSGLTYLDSLSALDRWLDG